MIITKEISNKIKARLESDQFNFLCSSIQCRKSSFCNIFDTKFGFGFSILNLYQNKQYKSYLSIDQDAITNSFNYKFFEALAYFLDQFHNNYLKSLTEEEFKKEVESTFDFFANSNDEHFFKILKDLHGMKF